MYAEHFHTDPSITDEELTPAVLEELGRLKAEIINAVLPHWYPDDSGTAQYRRLAVAPPFVLETRTEGNVITMNTTPPEIFETLALELEPLTPAFIRALAKALKVPA